MRAVILAAGLSWRLGSGFPPKSLFEFGGESLLLRHLSILSWCGVRDIVVGTGYREHLVNAELGRYRGAARVRTVFNPDFQEGNIVTLWRLAEALDCGEDVIVMDADVLYDFRLLERLLRSDQSSCLLFDRDYEPGEEPVKVCIRAGRVVEFGKIVDPAVQYDYQGESVGFFKLAAGVARRLRETVEHFIQHGQREALYEEAIRALLLHDDAVTIGYEEVTGLPWTEIDFHADLDRARRDVVPRLAALPTKKDHDAA